jgi:hypothetical protein
MSLFLLTDIIKLRISFLVSTIITPKKAHVTVLNFDAMVNLLVPLWQIVLVEDFDPLS